MSEVLDQPQLQLRKGGVEGEPVSQGDLTSWAASAGGDHLCPGPWSPVVMAM